MAPRGVAIYGVCDGCSCNIHFCQSFPLQYLPLYHHISLYFQNEFEWYLHFSTIFPDFVPKWCLNLLSKVFANINKTIRDLWSLSISVPNYVHHKQSSTIVKTDFLNGYCTSIVYYHHYPIVKGAKTPFYSSTNGNRTSMAKLISQTMSQTIS